MLCLGHHGELIALLQFPLLLCQSYRHLNLLKNFVFDFDWQPETELIKDINHALASLRKVTRGPTSRAGWLRESTSNVLEQQN